jgi:hypothetical protein
VSSNPAPPPPAPGPGSGQPGQPTPFWRGIAAAAAALIAVVGLLALDNAKCEWIGLAVGVALAAGLRESRVKNHTFLNWVTIGTMLVVGIAGFAAGHFADKIIKNARPHYVTMEQVQKEALHDHLVLATDTTSSVTARLRDDGPAVRVLLFEPEDQGSRLSDELWVYEVRGKRLKRVLRFRPTAPQSPAAEVTASYAGNPPPTTSPAQFVITLRTPARNLDGSGGADLWFELREPVLGLPQWPIPMILRYRDGRYAIDPVLSTTSIKNQRPADLITHRHLVSTDAALYLIRYAYSRPLEIRNQAGGVAPEAAAYAVDAYACRRAQLVGQRGPSPGLRLTTGYVVHEAVPNDPNLVQVVDWRIAFDAQHQIQAYPDVGAADVHQVGKNASGVGRAVRAVAGRGPRCFG